MSPPGARPGAIAARVGAICLALVACGGGGTTSAPRPSVDRAPPLRPVPEAAERYRLGQVLRFVGACDASGAAGLTGGRVAVADDEDNRLRIFDVVRGGAAVDVVDTAAAIADRGGKLDEMDLEAAATVGTRTYWIASHGRKKSGKVALSRLKLFASEQVSRERGASLELIGRPYSSMLNDMVRAPALARYDLAAAAARSPAEPGGLNIEGLTDVPETGHLLVGFRNPTPSGRALVVRLANPADVVDRGAVAEFADPIELDLGGHGIRSIASWESSYWIVGGRATSAGAPSRLYRWDGRGAPVWLSSIGLDDFNPEAVATVTVGDRTGLFLLSDDGERPVGGRTCKKLKDERLKSFRGAWIEKGE